jgi:class 3 adenylate cyclase
MMNCFQFCFNFDFNFKLRRYTTDSHVCRLARMALDVQSMMAGYPAPDGGTLSMRCGLHAGDTVGGVVGQKMVRYHLFGAPLEGVNKMEQTCEPGGVRQGPTLVHLSCVCHRLHPPYPTKSAYVELTSGRA